MSEFYVCLKCKNKDIDAKDYNIDKFGEMMLCQECHYKMNIICKEQDLKEERGWLEVIKKFITGA